MNTNTSSAPIILAESLCKRYKDRIAVNDLNFKIEKGQVVGFLGPNGAGKTTTLRMLTGFLPPTSGRALIQGIDIYETPLQAKKMIGYLPENPPVYLDLTVEEHLLFVAELKGLKAKRNAVDDVIKLAELQDAKHRLIRFLSKGFKQRVGLASALLGRPPLLILDEPTVGLDPVQLEQIRGVIRNLVALGDHTILLSTHILSEVQKLASHVLMIHMGKRVAFEEIEQLEKDHKAPIDVIFARLLIGETDKVAGVSQKQEQGR